MSHLVAVPVVLPAMTAALLVLAFRHGSKGQGIVSVISTALQLVAAIALCVIAANGPQAYAIGSWPAPFGIVLVLDRLSAVMLVLAAIIALAVVLYALGGWDTRGRHFHALFQFQLLGINGAFLTGDLFNLFVFFEVMLIASYGLMLHGGGPWRLKAGFQYVAINLIASTVFLFGVGLAYGATGTVNMADMALKAAALPEGDHSLMRAAAAMLLCVFAVKCALVPLHWWLPNTYAAAPAPAVALFAVLTKVGAYAIIRMHTLLLAPAAATFAGLADILLLPAAMFTLALGALGVLASRTLLDLASYSILASMGTLLIASIGLEARTLAAALYYLLHSTLIGAALFLLVDLIAACRSRADRLVPAPLTWRPHILASLFVLAAMGIVGLPPLSGFVGKLAILDSMRAAASAPLIWTLVLLASLLLLVAYAQAGSTLFWRGNGCCPWSRTAGRFSQSPDLPSVRLRGLPFLIVAVLIALTGALSIFGGPVMDAMHAAAHELLEPARYVRAVLGQDAVVVFLRGP
jgi:multicomponent K+:H+ antiporter subunit D